MIAKQGMRECEDKLKVCIMNKILWSAIAGGIIVVGTLIWYIFYQDTTMLSLSAPANSYKNGKGYGRFGCREIRREETRNL